MSIPFKSDASLRSLNKKVAYIKTQAEFVKMMDSATTNEGPYKDVLRFEVYPRSDGEESSYTLGALNINRPVEIVGIGSGVTIKDLSYLKSTTKKGLIENIEFYFDGNSPMDPGVVSGVGNLKRCIIKHDYSVGDYAETKNIFYNCSNISDIHVELLGDYTALEAVFHSCSCLSRVVVSDGLSSVGVAPGKVYKDCTRVSSDTCDRAKVTYKINDVCQIGKWYVFDVANPTGGTNPLDDWTAFAMCHKGEYTVDYSKKTVDFSLHVHAYVSESGEFPQGTPAYTPYNRWATYKDLQALPYMPTLLKSDIGLYLGSIVGKGDGSTLGTQVFGCSHIIRQVKAEVDMWTGGDSIGGPLRWKSSAEAVLNFSLPFN